MARVALTGGAYEASSLIAGAQRCVNLFVESVPQEQGEPIPAAHLLTPGLRKLMQFAQTRRVRGLYRATNNSLYAVYGNSLVEVLPNFTERPVTKVTDGTAPVSMSDNGVQMLVVDGSPSGWSIDLTTGAATAVSDPAFYGADRVDLINTEFVLNRPGMRQFYLSDSIAVTFDPLYISNKGGRQDLLVSMAVVAGQLWLLGQDTSEIYTYTGASDFPVQAVPGATVEYGCAAVHSIGRTDKSIFWLSRSKDGQGIVLAGNGYQADRISTHAIETAISGYVNIATAVGMTYQIRGHTIYVLQFQEATWGYDLATKRWHEWVWLDANGNEMPHRAFCMTFWNGQIIVGDRENGALYALDPNVFVDDGAPIKRLRSFPHTSGSGRRLVFRTFQADMQPGDVPTTSTASPPMVSLRWSDDRGASWGNAVEQPIGATGAYLTRPTWHRLGIATDRVFEISWSAPMHTALAGAFVTAEPAAT